MRSVLFLHVMPLFFFVSACLGESTLGLEQNVPTDETPALIEMLAEKTTTSGEPLDFSVTKAARGEVRSLIFYGDGLPPLSRSAGNDKVASAIAFISGLDIGLKSDLVASELRPIKQTSVGGRTVVKLSQYINEIEVLGSRVTIHLAEDNTLKALNYRACSSISTSLVAELTSAPEMANSDAELVALEESLRLLNLEYPEVTQLDPAYCANDFVVEGSSHLTVYDPVVYGCEGDAKLAWMVNTSLPESPWIGYELIISQKGEVLKYRRHSCELLNREIRDGKNETYVTANQRGVLVRKDAGGAPNNLPTDDNANPYTADNYNVPEADELWDYIQDTYDYYQTEHGRDGINGSGGLVTGTVRACTLICPLDNSLLAQGNWIMVGEDFVTDDGVGHEYTHGVTADESGLDSSTTTQAAAINESLSDIWGEFVDLSNGTGNDTPAVRWMIGDDLTVGSWRRNMKDPTIYGDPDKLSSQNYYTGADGSLYAHRNCGVINKLAYLLTDGDSFNGYTISSMGMSNVAQLFYFIQQNWLGPGSDFADVADGLIYAADTFGYGVANVTRATRAVEINPHPFFSVKSDTGQVLLEMDTNGDVYVPVGAVIQNASTSQLTPGSSVKEFVVMDGTTVVAMLRPDNGNLYLKGTASYVANLSNVNSTNELVVKYGVVTCSLIDKSGNLKYRRWLLD